MDINKIRYKIVEDGICSIPFYGFLLYFVRHTQYLQNFGCYYVDTREFGKAYGISAKTAIKLSKLGTGY